MSDVEKAISGLVEDEELLQLQHQQQTTSLNKTNYNLQNDKGNTALLQKQKQYNQHLPPNNTQNHHQQHHQQHHQKHQHHHQLLAQEPGNTTTATTNNNFLTPQQYNCLSRLTKLIFSTPGLVIMVVVYTIMGAFLFPLLEAPQDISKSALIAKSREECLKELWIITEKLNVLYERNWTMLVHEQLRRFEGTIIAATRNMAAVNGGIGGGSSTTSATSGTTNGAGYAGLTTAVATSATTTATAAAAATTTALGRYGNNGNLAEFSDLTATRWSFSEALLYSVTVITTIGHGSLTPRTAGGKIATIFYALIGVPLMLMCLSSLGALLAEALQCTYARLCCRGPQYEANGGNDLNDDDILSSKHKHNTHAQSHSHTHTKKRHQKSTTHSLSRDMVNVLEKAEEAAAAAAAHHEIKQSLQHQCDFQDHQNSINCKNCKYDAIIGESSNTNDGLFNYKLCNDATTIPAIPLSTAAVSSLSSTSSSSSSSSSTGATTAGTTMTSPAMTTIKLGHKEDCCQLLKNSPGKFTQHLASCMQLKMSPTITVRTSCSGSDDTATTTIQAGQHSITVAKQQQQQQYYQQRPDVMLMTTGHKLSLQQPVATTTTTTMATSCRLAMSPQQPPPPPSAPPSVAQQQRFYHNSTPAMATYHIVSSASANSSPTHQQSIRHYILTPTPPTTTSSSAALATGAQHFMALPTNMLRFHQKHEQTFSQQQQQQHLQPYSNVFNTTSNININPLALPASASATVYFPLVAPTAVATQNTSLTAVPSSSSQPLIKYHTIQMPHKRQQNILMLQQTDLQDNQIISNTANINAENCDVDAVAQFPPPPPPPAYQTATVHGIRRAKFLTKPLPQEINTLLHENDISCRHDLSPHLKTFTNASLLVESNGLSDGCGGVERRQQMPHNMLTATTSDANILSTERTREPNENETSMTTTAVTTNFNSFYGSNSNKTNNIASPLKATSSPPPLAIFTNNMKTNSNNATTTTATIYENQESLSSEGHQQQQQQQDIYDTTIQGAVEETNGRHTTAVVDIMEDEEEHEQQRFGNCPHGTPSRVPLLNSSSSTSDDKPHTRSFLNATAASFHRHTMNTFQRTNAPHRKSIIINRKGECNLHIPKRRNSSTTATVYYSNSYDDMLNSDDECGGILEGKNVYKLKDLHETNIQTDNSNKHLIQEDFYDNHSSLVSLEESTSQLPQVPIIVVLFILIFYVSLGTVIFALWENWSLIDGAYFCFVTLTTIGYGDFVPLKTIQGPEIQLFACCAYLLLGLVLVAMAFSILETQLIWKCKRLAVRLKLAKE